MNEFPLLWIIVAVEFVFSAVIIILRTVLTTNDTIRQTARRVVTKLPISPRSDYDVFHVMLNNTRKHSMYKLYVDFLRPILVKHKCAHSLNFLDKYIQPNLRERDVVLIQYLLTVIGIQSGYTPPKDDELLNNLVKLKEAMKNNDRESLLSVFGQAIHPIRNREWAKELNLRISENRSNYSVGTSSA